MNGDDMRKMIERIQAEYHAFRRLTEPGAAVKRYVEEVAEQQQKMANRLAAEMETAQRAQRAWRWHLELVRSIRQQQEAWTHSIRLLLEETPKHIRQVQVYLFERGWYLGPDAPMLGFQQLASLIREGQHEQIEETMQAWAEHRIDAILRKIETDFPARYPIVVDCLGAHREGKYTLSIPVLFAQADGLAKEIIGTFLFRGKPAKDFEKLLSSLEPCGGSSTLEALAEPLRSYSSLGKSIKCESPLGAQNTVNRHDVLHGTATGYADRAISLRVISLIDYLLGMRGMLNRHKELGLALQEGLQDALRAMEKHEGVDGNPSAEDTE